MALQMELVKQQLQNVMAQRDQAAQTFQQCVGAVALLSEQLKMIAVQEELAKKESEVGEAAMMDDMSC